MREKLSMDFGWRFHLDNMERPVPKNMMYYYYHTKAERGTGPAAPSFYDMDWEVVDLPHDYCIGSKVDFSVGDTEGYLRRENGWYRRLFKLDPADKGRRIQLQFDGVVTHAVVWVNGHLLYRNFCGYTSFCVDITDCVNYGDMLNEVSVYVDTKTFEGWWYEGAGIYRHVWMVKTAPISVETWGTYVDPERIEKTQDGSVWDVPVEARIRSILFEDKPVLIRQSILGPDGGAVAQGEQEVTALARGITEACMTLRVKDPGLWDVDDPILYTMRTELLDVGEGATEPFDTYDTAFGFRTVEYSVEGMTLNGKPIKLKGVCAHEDHANLGVAVPDGVREYRMKILKEMGCNAYRCSHNPPTPEVLDLCDRLGILVMDENRWFDSSEEGLAELEHMFRRDRNHPCIIMWSMANEEPMQGTERGQRIMRSMRFHARRFDKKLPIMMAMHDGCLEEGGVAAISDVIGINYQIPLFDEIHAKFPDIPLVASEIGGKMMKFDIMGDGSGEDWEAVDTRPFMMGMFKWVAFGYRGESRGWPRLFSRSGIVHPTGEPKENTWFYRQMWDEKKPFVKIWPKHWNFEGKEEEAVIVKVYSNAGEVELFQDGVSLGRKKVNPYERTEFSVTYRPGTLTAVGYCEGRKAAQDEVRTSGKPYAIVLRADKAEIPADRASVAIIRISTADENGIPAEWAELPVHVEVEGPATVLALSNNDAYDVDAANKADRKLFEGNCQLIIRSTTKPGQVRVRVTGDGLKESVLTLQAKPCVRPPHVELELDTDAMWLFAKMGGPN